MNAKDPTIVKVKKCIEQILDSGCRKIIIYPYGDMGVMTKICVNIMKIFIQ